MKIPLLQRKESPEQAGSAQWPIVYQVASWCLSYPDDQLLELLPLLTDALAEQPGSRPIVLP